MNVHNTQLCLSLVHAIERSVPLSEPVRQAFLAVPRHPFVPHYYVKQGTTWTLQETSDETVYEDKTFITQINSDAMPASSSTQPSVMAAMLEALSLHSGHRVLEIGTGTGYNAALIAHIVGHEGRVVSVDIDTDLVKHARQHLATVGIERVEAFASDGWQGFPTAAPYDRIIATASSESVPTTWLAQLAPGGVLVMNLVSRDHFHEHPSTPR